MNFLLKIVEGPNRGAEIALVEGVPVTVGKGDGCDIVLADATLPDAPLRLEPGPGGVTIDGEPMEAFHVKTLGATLRLLRRSLRRNRRRPIARILRSAGADASAA